MEQEIIEILREINPYVEIDKNANLLEEQILDSLGILVLITELEERYSVQIPLETIGVEDFTNISSIVRLMEGLLESNG